MALWLLTVVLVASSASLILCAQPHYCSLPSETGPCRAAISRYFFDTTSQSCKEFTYGGCQGNANNFRSISQCKAACVCTLDPVEGGNCTKPVQRFYYNVGEDVCSPITGCGNGGNLFPDQIACLDSCIVTKCFLPQEVGRCKANIPRYFYNKTSSECELFSYGGCDGNKNLFTVKEECNKFCTVPISGEEIVINRIKPTGVTPTVTSDKKWICMLPQTAGMCKASFPRFSFNATTKSCDFFIYSGCMGNENNFATEDDCKMACDPDIPTNQKTAPPNANITAEDCRLPPDSGVCNAYLPSFYYSASTRKCEPFIYSGCLGNRNRFSTEKECMDACQIYYPINSSPKSNNYEEVVSNVNNILTDLQKKEKEHRQMICRLPPEAGFCRGFFISFFHNVTSGACEEFIYGGCDGNENNFPKKEECVKTCLSN
ncbi:actinia tenebrosa protease inhibitors-like [Physella acuta]|uniref:actinia tenebrosa protease inhibitors-like n=1 Tax=Physella acuta TaxID=109671 RepID=UPI0027DD750C|nr:actinia tenebrosa protease inhibitors-like [Physella acuta]XP_059176536.1 actinia tenebrosa protease inhibitors-like [Physella acuta]XP_059176537.1 actinia tenebrosa protease inhibitors-like [Physella acuta]